MLFVVETWNGVLSLMWTSSTPYLFQTISHNPPWVANANSWCPVLFTLPFALYQIINSTSVILEATRNAAHTISLKFKHTFLQSRTDVLFEQRHKDTRSRWSTENKWNAQVKSWTDWDLPLGLWMRPYDPKNSANSVREGLSKLDPHWFADLAQPT